MQCYTIRSPRISYVTCSIFMLNLSQKISSDGFPKGEGGNMVFSPSPQWMLCTGPSFDINWVKQEGGREGGQQQLDPAVNVTLVGQLHPCQSLLLFHSPPLSSVYTSHLCCEDAALRSQRCHFADAVRVFSKQMSF